MNVKRILLCSTLFLMTGNLHLRATWSVVLADAQTKEVAVGTVTCLENFDLLAILPVVVVEKGAGAIQAFGDFDGMRRPILFNELINGLYPNDILALASAVPGHEQRQYGIIDTQGRPVTFTGSIVQTDLAWAGGVTGNIGSIYYAVQGNVMTGACVINDMETAILNTVGDIPAKLMAAMEAARAAGGDGRCSCSPTMADACGCPPPSFTKSGHVGGMIVARPGDSDDPVCDANGCADGDYFMRLNVAGQFNADPDPATQLQGLFDNWRAALVGRPDAGLSRTQFSLPAVPPNGSSTNVLRLELQDWQNDPISIAINQTTVQHLADSANISQIGNIVDNGNGTIDVTLTAGTTSGIDRFMVRVDDGIRPVQLMVQTEFEYFPLGDLDLDGLVDLSDLVALVNGSGPCPLPPATCLGDLDGDQQLTGSDLLAALPSWANFP